MKQQRNQIRAAEAVQANLGDIEAPESRFVDAGFVQLPGRNVDWGAKFMQAAKAGTDAYHATDSYKETERETKRDALIHALKFTETAKQRADEQGITAEEMPEFMAKQMVDAAALLPPANNDDSIANLYKDTFTGVINNRLGQHATTAYAANWTETQAQRENEMHNLSSEGLLELDDAIDLAGPTMQPSKVSKVWLQGQTQRISNFALDIEGKLDTYNEVYAIAAADVENMAISSGAKDAWYGSRGGKAAAIEAHLRDNMNVVSPAKEFENLVTKVNNQQGTDGVGAITNLNTTEAANWTKGVKAARAKITGEYHYRTIQTGMAAGESVDQMLDVLSTGVESEDKKLKQRVETYEAGFVQSLYTSMITETNLATKNVLAEQLDQYLIMNGDRGKKAVSTMMNKLSSQWQIALQRTDSDDAINVLNTISEDIWDTNRGSVTRQYMFESMSKTMRGAVMAQRAGIPDHVIIDYARGDLPEVDKGMWKARTGNEYNETRVTYEDAARKYAPWAGPKEIAEMTDLAMLFDYHGQSLNGDTFFENFGSSMSVSGKSPREIMGAGEQNWWRDLDVEIWGAKLFEGETTKVPNTGAWKPLVAMEQTQAGTIQAGINYMLANADDPGLREVLQKTMRLNPIQKKYNPADPLSKTYWTFDWDEGFVDDMKPPQIVRNGDNEWAIVLTRSEWTDSQAIKLKLDNDEIVGLMRGFDEHLAIKAGKDKEYAQWKRLWSAGRGWEKISNWFMLDRRKALAVRDEQERERELARDLEMEYQRNRWLLEEQQQEDAQP